MNLQSIMSIMLAGLIASLLTLGTPDAAQGQRRMPEMPQDQWVKLQAVAQIKDANDRLTAISQFLKEFPNTPFMANVYRLQFMSYREFTEDDDLLWDLGKKYVDAFTVMSDQMMTEPYQKNPILANMYSEVALEFASRGKHLDGALDYAIQALALMDPSVMVRSPKVTEEQWITGIQTFRGQILKTVGWIQYQRGALPEAEKALTDAVGLLPDEGEIHYHLGRTYLAQNQSKKGIDALLAAATAARPDPAAEEVLQQVYRAEHGVGGPTRLQADLQVAEARAQADKVKRVLANRLDVPAPDFTISSLDGNLVTISDLRGKVLVVNFWATWCGPCRKEMPALEELWKGYENSEDVAFLIVSVDQEKNKVSPYINLHGYTFPVYYGAAAAQLYNIMSIPTTLVIDPQGNVQYKHIGYRPDITDLLTWEIEALRKARMKDEGGRMK